MLVTVSELASRYRFSRDAIYSWARSGLIPADCVIRIGNSIRINSEEFEHLLRAGKLYRPRRNRTEMQACHASELASAAGFSEDQFTTRRIQGSCQHRFTDDGGTVLEDHPYSPRCGDPHK